jgi:hypothetical protein
MRGQEFPDILHFFTSISAQSLPILIRYEEYIRELFAALMQTIGETIAPSEQNTDATNSSPSPPPVDGARLPLATLRGGSLGG